MGGANQKESLVLCWSIYKKKDDGRDAESSNRPSAVVVRKNEERLVLTPQGFFFVDILLGKSIEYSSPFRIEIKMFS